MTIEKTSSNYRILDSGIAFTPDSKADLTFSLKMSDNFKFSIIFKFESNGGTVGEVKTNANVSENTIILTCVNFDNMLGTGTTTPVEVATYNNKKIYIIFWVYGLGDNKLKKMEYCFYSER